MIFVAGADIAHWGINVPLLTVGLLVFPTGHLSAGMVIVGQVQLAQAPAADLSVSPQAGSNAGAGTGFVMQVAPVLIPA